MRSGSRKAKKWSVGQFLLHTLDIPTTESCWSSCPAKEERFSLADAEGNKMEAPKDPKNYILVRTSRVLAST